MDERDLIDLGLVGLLAILAYYRSFGFAEPLRNLSRLFALFLAVDVRVYLVLSGLIGILFLGYLTMYMPSKDADRSIR